MATDCMVHTKWHDQEDALSLCDLPLHDRPDAPAPPDEPEQLEFEFDFGSMCSSVLTDQEMCTADEVFFKGQILPLRLSFSSRTASRSESMDHCSSAGFTSRSSSINSSTTSTSNPYKPKIHNQFHAHPSPKPQIRTSGSRTANRSRRWSVWDLFRLGPVQTPEIELEDLKVRTSNCKSSKGDGSIKKRDGLGKSSGFLRGCKCSVETVSFESVMVRSKSTSSGSRSKNSGEGTRDAKQQEVKKKKTRMSRRHRTLEWLKELSQSHATTPHHQIIV